MLYCDLSNAFVFEYYNFQPNGTHLMKSFLSRRTQNMKVVGGFSAIGGITVGVPQGSILRPLLFPIYAKNTSCLLNE